MRVVAGTARGRRLVAPSGTATRPTTDRVRESTFNALGSRLDLDGAVVVDLFAGSGAMGIEALSRGAGHAWFVESDARAVEVIDRNLAVLDFGDRSTVLRATVNDVIERLPAEIDLVVADPPYSFNGWHDLLVSLEPRLGEAGVVVVESDRPVELPPGWQKMREQAYGGTVIAFAAPPDDRHR